MAAQCLIAATGGWPAACGAEACGFELIVWHALPIEAPGAEQGGVFAELRDDEIEIARDGDAARRAWGHLEFGGLRFAVGVEIDPEEGGVFVGRRILFLGLRACGPYGAELGLLAEKLPRMRIAESGDEAGFPATV